MSHAQRASLEAAAGNIRAIVELEQRAHRQRGWGERVSDHLTAVVGSLAFVLLQIMAITAWIVWNVVAPGPLRFDPYPYGLLTFILTLEGVLIATFVLMTQNRMRVQSDARDHLNLQIDLLAEQELTLLIRMIRRMSDHLRVPPDTAEKQHAERLAEETNVYDLMQSLQQELPGRPADGGDK